MKITNKTTIRSESRVSFGSVSAIPDVPQIPAAKKMLSMVPEESETKAEKSEPVTIAETVLIWDVYLGPFGVCAQMNERIIISVLGRGQQHGAKILDMLDIPVRKLYNKGCYVKREFGIDRNNCKIQLEVSMKQANRMGGNIMGGGVALPMGHLMAPAYGGMGNVVWA